MGQHVTHRYHRGNCAAKQVRRRGYGISVVQSSSDIGRGHRDHARRKVLVIRAGKPWGVVILLRSRHLAEDGRPRGLFMERTLQHRRLSKLSHARRLAQERFAPN